MKCCREAQERSQLDLCRNPSPSRFVFAAIYKKEKSLPHITSPRGIRSLILLIKLDFYGIHIVLFSARRREEFLGDYSRKSRPQRFRGEQEVVAVPTSISSATRIRN